jgi:transcriptional regulator
VIALLLALGSSLAYGCADFLGGLGGRKAHVLRTVMIAAPASLVVELLLWAFVPGPWRAKAGTLPTDGVPTSYYTAVQFTCRAHIVDDPEAKAELLRRQLAHFQPDGDHAPVAVGQPPYGRMLPGIRGLRLEVTDVRAKFKYDDHKPVEHRTAVADRLTARGRGLDVPTARRQHRRLDRIGPWKP